MKTLDVAIFGTGGAAKGFHWHLNHPEAVIQDRDGQWCKPRVVGYLDDDETIHGQMQHGVPILGGMEWAESHPGEAVFVGLGMPRAREQVTNRLKAAGMWFPSFVSPDARVAMGTCIGEGCFVYAGSIINVDSSLGSHCYLNMNVTLGHDVNLGDYTVVYPGATISGAVQSGNGVTFGANSTILQNLTVGDYAVVGAATCVINDVTPNATVVGVPARVVGQ